MPNKQKRTSGRQRFLITKPRQGCDSAKAFVENAHPCLKTMTLELTRYSPPLASKSNNELIAYTTNAIVMMIEAKAMSMTCP